MLRRQWLTLAAVVMGVVTLLILASPLMAPYGTFTGLDGAVGVIDHGFQGNGISGAVYLIGDMFCHQEEARSFILNGSQMSFCIRDTGIIAGAFLGFILSRLMESRLSDRRFAWAGACLIAVTAVEWISEGFVGDMPSARFLSGMCCGIGVAIFLGWMLYRDTQNDVVL